MGLEILRYSCSVAGDSRDRGERPRLVRRQPRRPGAFRRGHSLARPHDRHRRGLRRHDDRPRVSSRLSQERAMAELFQLRGHAVRPEAGPAVRGVPRVGPGRVAPRGGRPLAGDARSGDGQFLLGAQLRAVAAGAAEHRRLVPGAAAGQHVRRRGVHRRRGADQALEPRGGAADGHCRHQPLPAALVAGRAEAWPTRRGSRSAPADCPVRGAIAVGRAIAAAAGDLRPHRPTGGRRHPRHARLRRRRRRCGRHPAVARRLVGDLAGAALPEPAREGHPRPADPGGQPRRVRPRPRDVHRAHTSSSRSLAAC